jgi:hypothetical protein
MGANAQTSVPLYVAAEVLTAADMNISAGTGVPVFATTVTRDAAFGGAGEKVLAEGQLAYIEASNIVQYYDGAAWATVGPATPSALVRVGGGTLSGTTTNFDNVFSATYLSYLITVNGGAMGVSQPTLTLRYAGPTTQTSGYYGGVIAATNASGTSSIGTNNGASFLLGSTGTDEFNGTITITQRTSAARASFNTAFYTTSINTVHTGGGENINARDYTGFALNASGTFTAGTVNIYGYTLS